MEWKSDEFRQASSEYNFCFTGVALMGSARIESSETRTIFQPNHSYNLKKINLRKLEPARRANFFAIRFLTWLLCVSIDILNSLLWIFAIT